MKKNNLTDAQQDIVKLIQDLKGGFIYVDYSRRLHKWRYFLMRDDGKPIDFVNKCRPPSILRIKRPQTIRALIRKGVLIPEMDDKEFEVQLALGSIDWRVYNLAEEFDKC